MQINLITNIRQSKPSFNARYRIPRPTEDIMTKLKDKPFRFYEVVKKKPVQMFENNKYLDVFTGKDAKLFNETFPKGAIKHDLYEKTFNNETFKTTKNIHELDYKMLQEEYHH